MKKILLASMFIVSCFAFGQKVKIKKDIAYVDGKEYVIAKEDRSSESSYTIQNLNHQDLFYLKHVDYKDIKEITGANKDGTVDYYEVYNSNITEKLFECAYHVGFFGAGNNIDTVIINLYNNDVIKSDGSIDQTKLDLLSRKLGFEFSRKRNEQP